MSSTIIMTIAVVLILFCVIITFYALSLVPFGIFFQCKTSGVPISMLQLARMNVMKIPMVPN